MSGDDSFVTIGKGGTTFVGPDATRLVAAIALRGAIGLYVKTGMQVTTAYTPSAMRAAASRITGKPYKRTELAQAQADLTTWIDAMRAALPVIREERAP
jgi:AMMECR1 domain-containing protein